MRKNLPLCHVLKTYRGKKARGRSQENTVLHYYLSNMIARRKVRKCTAWVPAGRAHYGRRCCCCAIAPLAPSGRTQECGAVQCSSHYIVLGWKRRRWQSKRTHRDNAIKSVINNVFNSFCIHLARTQISDNDCFLLCTITRHALTMDKYLF